MEAGVIRVCGGKKRALDPPGTGVAGNWELPHVGARNRI